MREKQFVLQIGLASAFFLPLLDLWVWTLAMLLPRAGKPMVVAILAAALTAGCLVGALWRVFRRRPHERKLR